MTATSSTGARDCPQQIASADLRYRLRYASAHHSSSKSQAANQPKQITPMSPCHTRISRRGYTASLPIIVWVLVLDRQPSQSTLNLIGPYPFPLCYPHRRVWRRLEPNVTHPAHLSTSTTNSCNLHTTRVSFTPLLPVRTCQLRWIFHHLHGPVLLRLNQAP